MRGRGDGVSGQSAHRDCQTAPPSRRFENLLGNCQSHSCNRRSRWVLQARTHVATGLYFHSRTRSMLMKLRKVLTSRGYLTTVMREIPFSLIQFPLWEALKRTWARRKGAQVDPLQSATCGALVMSQLHHARIQQIIKIYHCVNNY